jgi:hypothetical protein
VQEVVALSSQAVEGHGGAVLGQGKLISGDAGATPNFFKACTPCFHTSRTTSLPHPEFCYELIADLMISIVCGTICMACAGNFKAPSVERVGPFF